MSKTGNAMSKINLGIVSQTPVVRLFKEQKKESIKLSDFDEDEYMTTIGGVAPMVRAQLNELEKRGLLNKATWLSLNPNAPKKIKISKNLNAVSVYLEGQTSNDYVNFKEDIWSNLHNLSSREFTINEYLGYFDYNSKLAKIMLQDYQDINLFEIHDFQQLLLGSMVGPTFPTILRWHTPFVPEILSKNIRKFIINGLESNDAVIVSTKRDLEGLIRAGYKGNANQIYPHLDHTLWHKVRKNTVEEFSMKFGIKSDDFLIMNVARMDGIKSQDDLIKAVAMLKNPNIKLMLVGGSSFTSKELGHPKGKVWMEGLLKLIRKLKLQDQVIFTGNLDHEGLESAYTRADLFVLPSRMEGFGLVVVEGWLYNTPAIVSDGAGVSELVTEGVNGFTFKAGNSKDLAAKISKTYKDSILRFDMGFSARTMAKACYVSTTIDSISKVYQNTIENFGK